MWLEQGDAGRERNRRTRDGSGAATSEAGMLL